MADRPTLYYPSIVRRIDVVDDMTNPLATLPDLLARLESRVYAFCDPVAPAQRLDSAEAAAAIRALMAERELFLGQKAAARSHLLTGVDAAVAAEREACAKVCDDAARRMAPSRENGALGRKLLAEDLAADKTVTIPGELRNAVASAIRRTATSVEKGVDAGFEMGCDQIACEMQSVAARLRALAEEIDGDE